MIKFENVVKEYKTYDNQRVVALKNINMTIQQGEFVGLLGMNGSGKSTLARLINGLLKPTSGRVYVNGLDTAQSADIIEIRRNVGMVFQNPDNQIVSSIVEEDIAFGPENLGLSEAEVKARVDWAIDIMGLAEYRNHAPHLLSGGQKQKVAIASALAMKPSALVLDEPTSMLDPQTRLELIEQLRSLNTLLGVTIILITHNIEDLIYTNRLVSLNQGEIILDAPTTLAFQSPQLEAMGFHLPEVVQLVANLRSRGIEINKDIMTVDNLVEFICRK